MSETETEAMSAEELGKLLRHVDAWCAFDTGDRLRAHISRLERERDEAEDKAYVLGARFGWNCAAEEWGPDEIERSMSPDTWARRDAARAERRQRFDTAIAARSAGIQKERAE